MAEAQTAKAVQLLDLMGDFFPTMGTGPAPLLQDAMPHPGLPLVHFNDRRCGTIAELRSVILKARRLAHDDAERQRAAAAPKAWLPAQIAKKTGRGGRHRGNVRRPTSCRLASPGSPTRDPAKAVNDGDKAGGRTALHAVITA
jgi:hypothetical protein